MANQNRYKKEVEILLLKWGGHRTAEQILWELKKQYRFLSIGTIYRNLTALVQEGKIMKTSGIFDKIIYETAKPLHGHIVCHASGSIFDVDISHIMIDQKIVPPNFNLQSINVIFDGHFSGDEMTCAGVAKIMHETEGMHIDPVETKKMLRMGK